MNFYAENLETFYAFCLQTYRYLFILVFDSSHTPNVRNFATCHFTNPPVIRYIVSQRNPAVPLPGTGNSSSGSPGSGSSIPHQDLFYS